MYNGLTTADKGALTDAKAKGAEWVARDDFMSEINGFIGKPRRKRAEKYWLQPTGTSWNETITIDKESLQFVQWDNPEPVNIDLALAQIAEMESAEKPSTPTPLTWNERINQMTVEEKLATMFGLNSGCPFDQFNIDKPDNWCETRKCKDCKRDFLNSPYTEGEPK